MIGEDDVARLLDADVAAALEHLLENLSIAHTGAVQLQASVPELPLEPQVGHDRRDDRIAPKLAPRLQPERDQSHELVPVDLLTLFVDDDQAVRIAVERQANIGAAR